MLGFVTASSPLPFYATKMIVVIQEPQEVSEPQNPVSQNTSQLGFFTSAHWLSPNKKLPVILASNAESFMNANY